MNLFRYLEQMIENVKKLDKKRYTASWNKLRHSWLSPIQYLLQQNHFSTGEDKLTERGGRATLCRRHAPTHLFMLIYEDRPHSIDQRRQQVFGGDIRPISDVRAP